MLLLATRRQGLQTRNQVLQLLVLEGRSVGVVGSHVVVEIGDDVRKEHGVLISVVSLEPSEHRELVFGGHGHHLGDELVEITLLEFSAVGEATCSLTDEGIDQVIGALLGWIFLFGLFDDEVGEELVEGLPSGLLGDSLGAGEEFLVLEDVNFVLLLLDLSHDCVAVLLCHEGVRRTEVLEKLSQRDLCLVLSSDRNRERTENQTLAFHLVQERFHISPCVDLSFGG